MSERAQRMWEQMHGKGNPLGGNQSDIEVDENYAIHCDDCNSIVGGTEEDDPTVTCDRCGGIYGPCCTALHDVWRGRTGQRLDCREFNKERE